MVRFPRLSSTHSPRTSLPQAGGSSTVVLTGVVLNFSPAARSVLPHSSSRQLNRYDGRTGLVIHPSTASVALFTPPALKMITLQCSLPQCSLIARATLSDSISDACSSTSAMSCCSLHPGSRFNISGTSARLPTAALLTPHDDR